jgi:ATP-dependent Clp protease protease subunit
MTNIKHIAFTLLSAFLGVTAALTLNQNTTATDLAPLTPNVQASPAPLSNLIPEKAHVLPAPTIKNIQTIKPDTNRTVFIYGEISFSVAEVAETIKNLSQQSKDPIYLLINSPGGSVLDGALVISAIEASPAPVYTVCLQICASMAAMIHQYGHKRMMVDRSILMFHDAAGGLQGYMHHMVSRLNQMHNYIHKMDKYISQRSGINFERYLQEANRELWLDAEDATGLQLNDSIVSVLIPKQNAFKLPEMSEKTKSINFVWK